MRKLVIILVLNYLTIVSFGQMIFNTIPMGGPYYNFKLELKKKGFTFRSDKVKEAENIYSYTGKFIDKEVDLKVSVSPTAKIVWKVDVEFPESSSWDTIRNEFLDLGKKMTQKYGNTLDRHAFFSSPYYDGGGNELLAIYQNKCTYDYNWHIENGSISLKIISHKQGTALINIWYEDKDASATNTAEKDKIIMDGL